MSSSRSWELPNDWFSDLVLQGSAAFLESRHPDRDGADHDGHAVSADLRSRAARPRAGVSGRAIYRFSGARPGDDERAAKCFRQQLVVIDSVQDQWQSGVRSVDAAIALGSVR